ncbi:Hypothetical predicted protein [Paramuricea clavata]|uniref:Uncharacterized protein n=1 Tax=Paramuricea clavata TaxID=317549 RepID=A0A7D9ELK2_PARCT|nr:Hypothetical predicted protein [Paramuricea clavata]
MASQGTVECEKIVDKCVLCRKVDGKSYQAPISPPLPEFKVQRNQPFSLVAVDFAGFLYVKTSSGNEKGMVKTWISLYSLYTCCSTRVVHLDLVPNMSNEAFIPNFRRFVARRGKPCM